MRIRNFFIKMGIVITIAAAMVSFNSLLASAATTTPTVAPCPSGEVPTSDKPCCPIQNVQYNDLHVPNPLQPEIRYTTCVAPNAASCAAGQVDKTKCLFAVYINPLINLLAVAVGLVVTAAIIYGGIEFTTSSGDPQRTASGKKHITNALIGLIVFFLLYAFLQFLIPGGSLNVQ